MDDNLYMTAEEAAEALGVSVSTIYAYVSRSILRSHKPPGARSARYWRADVERAKSKQRNAGPAPHQALVGDTEITVITPDGPFYRGHSALELSQHATLEEVAAILWNVAPESIFTTAPSGGQTLQRLWPALAGLGGVDRALATFPIVEHHNPLAYDLSPHGFARTAAEAMRWFAAMIVGNKTPADEPLHQVLASGSAGPPELADLVRRLLVLSADHELDVTTYAVRAAANAGVTPYKIITAGLCASSGRRASYSRTEGLHGFMEELLNAPDPRETVLGRYREGEAIPGFGTGLYAEQGDPRVREMVRAMTEMLPDDTEVRRLSQTISFVEELTGEFPDYPILTYFMGRKLGFGRKDLVNLRIGRVAGWFAHAMEQYHGHDTFRPRALYTGPLPSSAKPFDPR